MQIRFAGENCKRAKESKRERKRAPCVRVRKSYGVLCDITATLFGRKAALFIRFIVPFSQYLCVKLTATRLSNNFARPLVYCVHDKLYLICYCSYYASRKFPLTYLFLFGLLAFIICIYFTNHMIK